MRMGQEGLGLLKRFEGCELTAYQDSVGVWTIGYGHTSRAGDPKVRPGMTISKAEAEEILRADLRQYEDAVRNSITRTMTQHEFDAMVSLCYNIGPAGFARSSVKRKFNAGDKAGAADAFRLWNKAGGKVLRGLTRRREAERELFLKSVAEKPKPKVVPEVAAGGAVVAAAGAAAAAAGIDAGTAAALVAGLLVAVVAAVVIVRVIRKRRKGGDR